MQATGPWQCFLNWGEATLGRVRSACRAYRREMPSRVPVDRMRASRNGDHRHSRGKKCMQRRMRRDINVQARRGNSLWSYAHIRSWRASSIHCTQHARSRKEQGETRQRQNLICLQDAATNTSKHHKKANLN